MNSPPENISSQRKRLLAIGFGDVAERLALRLYRRDWKVTGLRRSAITSDWAEMLPLDVRNKGALQKVLAGGPDQVLVTMTPDERSPAGYKAAYLQVAENLARACNQLKIAPHIIFVSSTAVYGQDDGSLVDEQSEIAPEGFNGQILAAAESLLEASGLPLTIVRFSGIYGRRQRALADMLRAEQESFRPERWTNRIHIRDVIGTLEFALRRYADRGEALGLLLASDLRPEKEGVIENWLRSQLQLPALVFAATEPSSGKRCSSARLRKLGYRLEVEDFRSGYLAGR